MKHRFRYLDERGQQVEVADLAALRELARAGKVDDDTLLYDGLTDEWAPASAHSAYRLLDDPLARGPETGGQGGEERKGEGIGKGPGPADPGHSGAEPAFPELDVTLAPDDEIESTEEVVEKLLRERERDREQDRLPSEARGFSAAPESGGEREPAAENDPWGSVRRPRGLRAPDPDDEPIRPPRRHRSRRRTASLPEGSGDAGRDAGRVSSAKGDRGRSAASGGGWRRVEVPGPVVAAGGVLIVVLGLYAFSRVMNPSGAAEASTGLPESAGETVRSPANSTWSAAEGGAFRDMVEGVDSLRTVYAVERIPPSWLAGPYLADADTFPEVREYWDRYTAFVDAVRSQDTALFRRSFVTRLQDQGVSGPIVSIRLASALERFQESQPARDTVYERMEDLATSALDLHDLLADRSDDIVHDPVTEERASRQPILEAWSDDAYLRQTLWSLLDRITANLALLEYDAGSGRSDLTERLFQELRTRSLGREGDAGDG